MTITTTSIDSTSGKFDLTRPVLWLVAAGLSNPQMAERLALSPHTVQAHVRSIYSKIGVSSRSAATRYALEHTLM